MRQTVLAVLLGAFLVWHQANAAPLLWTLSDIVFPGGGTLSGTFVFDADAGPQHGLGVYSNIDITTSANNSFSGAAYTLYNPVDSTSAGQQYPNTLFLVTGSVSNTLLVIELTADMTDAGGSIPIDYASEYFCTEPSCTIVSSFIRAAEGVGFVTTAASVPEPPTIALLAVAIFGVASLARAGPFFRGGRVGRPLAQSAASPTT